MMQTRHTLIIKVSYHLLHIELSILRDYQQTPNKIMKNQGENKNRNNTFDSHGFIHYIADLIGSLSIFHITLLNDIPGRHTWTNLYQASNPK